MKRDSQYQDESVQDWAAHLEYLQSILIEFDPGCAPEEGTMIQYFREGLRLSMQVEMEQRGRELDSFKEIVKKAVDAEAKAAFRPRSYARNTNQHCLWGSRLSEAKTSAQGQPMKDPRVKEPKPKSQEQKASAFQRSDSAETSEQAWTEKRKSHNQERRPQDTTPATEVNTTNTLGGPSNGGEGGGGRFQKDLAQAICYNCNKKGHFARKCLKPPKLKN